RRRPRRAGDPDCPGQGRADRPARRRLSVGPAVHHQQAARQEARAAVRRWRGAGGSARPRDPRVARAADRAARPAASGHSIAAFVAGNAAVVAADNAGLPPGAQDWTSVQAFVTTATEKEGVREIVVADASGIVRAASRDALIGQRYAAMATAAAGPDAGLRFVRPIDYAGARFGTVDIVLGRKALDEAIATSQTLLAAVSALVMLVVLIVGYLSGAMVTRPLRRLRNALDDAARNGFALRISHARRDEFGETFDAFNRAAAEAEELSAGQRAETEGSLLATRIAA